jgi:hypothetical protein
LPFIEYVLSVIALFFPVKSHELSSLSVIEPLICPAPAVVNLYVPIISEGLIGFSELESSLGPM